MTRQIQNGFLRDRGLWPKLERSELDLATVADGLWTLSQQEQTVEWCEQLRLLRWVLGVDAEIMPLAHFPPLDFSLPLELLQYGEIPPQQWSQPVEAWEIRLERDLALEYASSRHLRVESARAHSR